jgi:hypothetical protein
MSYSPAGSIDDSIRQDLKLKSNSSFASKTDTLSTKTDTCTEDDSKHWSGSILSDVTDTMEVLLETKNISGDSHVSSASPLAVETAALMKGLDDKRSRELKPAPGKRISKRYLAEMTADVMNNTMEERSDAGDSHSADHNSNRSLASRQSTCGDLSLDSMILVKLPATHMVPLRREKITEVSSAPPSKPRRRPSNEVLSHLLPADFVPPRRASRQLSRRRIKKVNSDEDNMLDISNHSAPPSMGRSNSSSSRSTISDKKESQRKLLSPVRARRMRRAVSDMSCNQDTKPQKPSRKSSSVPVDENPTQTVKIPAGGTQTDTPKSPSGSGQGSSSGGAPPIMRAEDIEAR